MGLREALDGRARGGQGERGGRAWALIALPLLLAAAPATRQGKIKVAPPPAAAMQDYVPKPALWLVRDADTRIYLFGTIHMLPVGFRWRTAAFDEVVGRAETLVVETHDPPGTQADAQEAALFERYFMAPKPRPVATRVPRKHRVALGRALAGIGSIPPQGFDLMQTWAIAFLLSMDQTFQSMGADQPGQAPGVEDQLEAAFAQAGKPIGSIEDGDAVMRAFFGYMAGLPEREQVDFLVEAVKADPANGGEEDDLEDVHHWAVGKPETLMRDVEKAMPPAMYDMLVVRRNRAWTDWLAARLDKPGTVLVAVGAGHLAGKDSLQTMLAKRGLAVARVQ